MSTSLGILTVAEGIETAEQAARMRALGCTYGQGYHFARPLTAVDIEAATRAIKPAVIAVDVIDTAPPMRRARDAEPCAADPRHPHRLRRGQSTGPRRPVATSKMSPWTGTRRIHG